VNDVQDAWGNPFEAVFLSHSDGANALMVGTGQEATALSGIPPVTRAFRQM
jgi:hypothetical protein